MGRTNRFGTPTMIWDGCCRSGDARVYYRMNNGAMEILAKSGKDNQQEVIDVLKKMYD
ncbi:hypothetical protein J25TS5_33440 [Paenibacillus faecis]|nr:hypothetical protein J25TS5_33440 [Paenibacillus faecis]